MRSQFARRTSSCCDGGPHAWFDAATARRQDALLQSGEVAGTVGGGCIEAEVWAEAREALRSGNRRSITFLTAEEASEEGMFAAAQWTFHDVM